MEVNYVARVVTYHLAYYGAPLSGRGTNVEHLKRSTPGSGQLELTANDDERTLRTWLPCDPAHPGFTVQVRLHAATGFRVDFEPLLTRKDGVVYVADSAAERLRANEQFFAALLRLTVPVVVQLNKRDVPTALPVAALTDALFARWPDDRPRPQTVEAVAKEGRGVHESYRALLAQVLAR